MLTSTPLFGDCTLHWFAQFNSLLTGTKKIAQVAKTMPEYEGKSLSLGEAFDLAIKVRHGVYV